MDKLLIDFDMILDSEYAILKLIKDKYNNKNYFDNLNFIDNDIDIKYRIMHRSKYNILSLICTDNSKDHIDYLLNELYEYEYEDIISYSNETNFKIFLDELIKTKLMCITVLCKNKKEEQLCKKYKYNSLLMEEKIDWELLNKEYDIFYFRYMKYLLDTNCKLKGKTVYLSNSILNIIEKQNIINSSILDTNIYKFIEVYNIKSPIGL